MMNDLARCAATLADALMEETTALAASDLATASALLPRKRDAIDAFGRAHAACTQADAGQAREALSRLRDAARLNQLQLQRAIAIQSRIIEIVARALPRAAGAQSGYGATGLAHVPRTAAPVRIFARI